MGGAGSSCLSHCLTWGTPGPGWRPPLIGAGRATGQRGRPQTLTRGVRASTRRPGRAWRHHPPGSRVERDASPGRALGGAAFPESGKKSYASLERKKCCNLKKIREKKKKKKKKK